jgi:hypothetical protein
VQARSIALVGGMKMRLSLIAKLSAGAVFAVITWSNASAAPANGAAMIEAVQMTDLVEHVGYCTLTDNRGRIIFRRRGHCAGRGVTCWSGIPHRSNFLQSGFCRRGEGGF